MEIVLFGFRFFREVGGRVFLGFLGDGVDYENLGGIFLDNLVLR